MNGGLVRAIRERLSNEPDEELLRLWVDNDRGHHSAETFEAVRSLLGERGVDPLPPQNDPPPMAERAPARHVQIAAHDPVASFWMEWLRAVLWIGAALGVVQVIGWLFLLWWFVHAYWGVGTPFAITPWEALMTPIARVLILNGVLTAWLLLAVRLGFALHRRARGVLIAYAWADIVSTVLWIGSNLYTSAGDPQESWVYTASSSAHDLELVMYSVIVLLLLSRPQVKDLFACRNEGFDVATANEPSASAAASSAEDCS